MHLHSSNSVPPGSVAILGYGNQGRAHALNLRDSGVKVVVGARADGPGFARALADGFVPTGFAEAAAAAEVVMLLFPDTVIPAVYAELSPMLAASPKIVGFAHGFAFHFGLVEPIAGVGYILVGPKGAGAVLRRAYVDRTLLPMVCAVAGEGEARLWEICKSYARAAGGSLLVETTFAEETECDLFGEQAVLCGGIPELIRQSFDVLVSHGHGREMAFFETCYEARMILELLLAAGPDAFKSRISPTAAYGGLTRGRRLVNESTRRELENIFREIRDGSFAREFVAEAARGLPTLRHDRDAENNRPLEQVYQKVKADLGGKV